jgi:hypothetical protein
MELPVTLIKGDKVSDKTDYRDNLPQNYYAVRKDILGARGYMLCYPGLTLFGTGFGTDRCAIYNERFEKQYRVSGTKFCSVSSSGLVTEIGDVSGSSQARMHDLYSFNTQGIIADGNFYLYDATNGFRQVTDSDLGNPIDGVWVDGYYFMTDGEYLFHTDIDDEEAIDPLKFATAEFMPDPSLGIEKTQDNKVLVFGRYTLEYFRNDASSDFSFIRIDSRAQKIGIVATHAKCESEGNFYITGGRRNESLGIYSISIGSSTKISTREIDILLEQYDEPDLSDMRMESRSEKGTNFIKVHLPNETFCFNVGVAKTIGIDYAWTILKSGVTGVSLYRAINGVFDAKVGKWIYGDKRNTNIGYLDDSVFTQYGDVQEGILYTPFLNLKYFSIDEIDIYTIPGHTTTDDAKVGFSITYNGLTYGKEWFAQYGEQGKYLERFILRQIGYVDDWIGLKFRVASKSRTAFGLMRITYA